jgi:hypothetical protein
MAKAKSLSGPAQRAEKMPGAPSSAATDRPESSARATSPERSAGLEQGVAGEGALGLVRFGQIHAGGGDHRVMSVQQGFDLARLAGIVGRRDQPHAFD